MKILWTRLALQDLEQAWDYIAAGNPAAAEDVVEKIAGAVGSLPSYPQLGRLGRVKGTRELVVAGTPFVIPYRLKGDQIQLLAVLHVARRWPGDF
ncbi:MAG TPA: type II toxin-antitoxin system RelE/ParE family toxin [bacterium]|nr:type II toxin-antitoxin system RelE/ParE family toxin [bacterium]